MGLLQSTVVNINTGFIGPCVCGGEPESSISSITDSDSESTEEETSGSYLADDDIKQDDDIQNGSSLGVRLKFVDLSSEEMDPEPIPSDLHSLHAKKQNTDSVPKCTKRIMHLSYIIASTLKQYFESAANQCEFGEIAVMDILKHIHISGDWPRNYLLGIDTEQTHLDIIVNTRELSKIHLKHLRQYHYTEEQQTSYSQCILWNHYMNKWDESCIQKELALRTRYNNNAEQIANVMMSIEYISECRYILNSTFIVSILVQEPIFFNKVSVYRDPKSSQCCSYHMQIIDDLHLSDKDVVLNGLNFHMFDHHEEFYTNVIMNKEKQRYAMKQFHGLQRKKLIKYKQEDEMHLFMSDMINTHEFDKDSDTLHMRLSTRRVFDPSDIISMTAFKRIEFTIPKYKSSLSKVLSQYDTSLNFFVIPLANVIDDDMMLMHGMGFDYDWNGKIMNGVHKYNAFKDVEKQIVTHPFPEKLLRDNQYAPYIYFWRLIKICMQCVEYKIDEEIVKMMKEYYKYWIQNDGFITNGTDDYGYEDLLNTLFDETLCCSWIDFKTMLEKFEIFNFNHILLSVLNKSNQFKKRFIEELNDQDNDVIDLFQQYDYPID